MQPYTACGIETRQRVPTRFPTIRDCMQPYTACGVESRAMKEKPPTQCLKSLRGRFLHDRDCALERCTFMEGYSRNLNLYGE